MFGSNVAPKRKVKEAPADWACKCTPRPDHHVRFITDEFGIPIPIFRVRPGWMKRCPDCEAVRP